MSGILKIPNIINIVRSISIAIGKQIAVTSWSLDK